MIAAWIIQIAIFLLLLTLVGVSLGEYMARVFSGKRTFLSAILTPLEKLIYKILGIDEGIEMSWKTYVFNLVIFSLISILGLFLLQLVQQFLPLNPQNFSALRWDTALNTAVSFVTNTNWQAYAGESTMSYFTQMAGLAVQNFISSAVGIAVAVAFIKSFTRSTSTTIGNFWIDLTRSVVHVLLPLSILLAIFLVSQGVVQNFNPYTKVQTLEGVEQVIAQGPAASQVAIKVLGTNGGGFFNTNSSHPFENPNPATDFAEIFALLIISAALPFTFGAMVKKRRQGWAIFIVMLSIYLIGLGFALWSEYNGNPFLLKSGVLNGINMEGKEVRTGILSSVFFGTSTTATSCGAVNAMHDSLMPLTSLVLMFNMMIGEVVFGGTGVGLVGLFIYAILTMFIVGLMIGRTPEIYGKKLEPFEMIMATIVLLLPSIIQLIFDAVTASTNVGISGLNNSGPHGLSEIMYAFASGAGNNGSAFAGLNANTPFYNITLSIAMLTGRFATIIPSLAIAGSLVKKKFIPEESRFPTSGPLFVSVLMCIIIIVGALTFFPFLTLGPILEHLMISAGSLF